MSPRHLVAESIFDEFKFSDVIPDAYNLGDDYLRQVAGQIRRMKLPVQLSVQDIVVGQRLSLPGALVVTPNERRVRHLEMLNYSLEMGRSLKIGWYLSGRDRAEGGSQFGGRAFGLGVTTQADYDQVEALVQHIHDYPVTFAIEWLIKTVTGRSPSSENPRGFLDL